MKIPKVRKLQSGNYFIQLRLGGISMPITASTAAECRKQAELIKAQHRSGASNFAKGADKIIGVAIDDYINARANLLSPSTIRSYRSIQRNFRPDILRKRFRDIKSWQSVINEETRNYAPKTLKNIWRFLSSVMRENDIEPPKIALPQIIQSEHKWLDPEQIPVFVSALKGEACEIGALLALHSLRRSEIYALTWDKIDLRKGLIRVSGAAVFDENNNFVQKDTNKNTSSSRTVPIMIPSLTAALQAVPEKSGLVVNSHPNVLLAQINRVCDRAELPRVGIHGLRHSFASLAYHLGWPEQQTMRIGGWSTPDVMHKIYTHLAEADMLKAQNSMAAFYTANFC